MRALNDEAVVKVAASLLLSLNVHPHILNYLDNHSDGFFSSPAETAYASELAATSAITKSDDAARPVAGGRRAFDRIA